MTNTELQLHCIKTFALTDISTITDIWKDVLFDAASAFLGKSMKVGLQPPYVTSVTTARRCVVGEQLLISF